MVPCRCAGQNFHNSWHNRITERMMSNMRRRPGGQAARTPDPCIRSNGEEASPPAGSIALYSAGNRQQNNHLEEETERDETVEFNPRDQNPLFHDESETQPRHIAPNTSTMANSSGEGPVYTRSGLQLTHRASPLRGTGTSTNRYSIPSTGRMELLSSSHHEHTSRQNRLLICVRLGVVALCAFLAVGTKVAFSTALHEHRMMAAAAAAASAGANINTNELQTTKMGKVTSPRSLAKKRRYAEDVVQTLRSEFDAWSERHGRDYGSTEETERRFGIWLDNHHE